MKITSTEIFKADLPLLEPFRIAFMVTTVQDSVFLRINTDSGVYGLGETAPALRICGENQGTSVAIGREIAAKLKGRDPREVEARLDDIEALVSHNPQIRSAFDMALYDIAAKVAGVPLYQFLGGARRNLVTDLTVPIKSPKDMAAKAKEIVARGFTTLKIKVGVTPQEDIERIRGIREAVGPAIALRIDANQGWDPPSALAVLNRVVEYGVEYCEQPVPAWDFAGMAEVRRRSPIPIMADESVFDHHDAVKLAEGDCCDYFNIKLAKSGGIRGGARIAAVASATGKNCMVGSMMESRLGLAASVHFACAHQIVTFLDLDTPLLLAQDPVVGGYRYDGGNIIVDDAPGLGVDLEPKFLAGLERTVVE